MKLTKEVVEVTDILRTWLAEKLGKSYAIVNAYAQNLTQPSLEVLYEIASILKVEPKELLNSKIK